MQKKIIPIPNLNTQQIPVDITQAIPRPCSCGCVWFDKAFRLGVISAIAPGNRTGKEVVVEYPTYLCRECGVEAGKKKE